VTDSPGSKDDNDPNNLRLAAEEAPAKDLISNSEATRGKRADLVTAVAFRSSADVLYPLGDPEASTSVFAGIGNCGGTAIGDGIEAAIDELSEAGYDLTANGTGTMVLMDSLDANGYKYTHSCRVYWRRRGCSRRFDGHVFGIVRFCVLAVIHSSLL
jgi:hypothetical protein